MSMYVKNVTIAPGLPYSVMVFVTNIQYKCFKC